MRTILTFLLLGLALRATPQIVKAEYFLDDAAVPYGQGTPLTMPANTGEVTITANLSLNSMSPGIHQIFIRVREATEGWSTVNAKVFFIPWPADSIVGFRYSIDPQSAGSSWTYSAFPSPSTDVNATIEIDLGQISKGIHFIEAMAKTKGGIWTPVSRGLFFSLYSEPLNITSLEYYFEDEYSSKSPLYTVSNFDPSPDITLDSVTFTIPVTSLENLKSYFMYVRAVDEAGNKSFFLSDTLVYHGPTDIRDNIYLGTDMIIFPNPVSDLMNIRFIPLNRSNDFVLKLFDESGRVIMEKGLSFRTEEYFTLSTSGLKPGVYRIVISTTTGKPVVHSGFVKN